MECSICMERDTDYPMSGCCHSVCIPCAEQMAEHTLDEFTPFGKEVRISLRVPKLTCPLCRAPEIITPSYRKELNDTFPEAYKIWFQIELFRDADGTMYYTSLRKNNFRLLPTEPDDIYFLLSRMEYTSRTTGCYLGHHNLYNDPDYFILWYPVKHKYPSIKLNHLSAKCI